MLLSKAKKSSKYFKHDAAEAAPSSVPVTLAAVALNCPQRDRVTVAVAQASEVDEEVPVLTHTDDIEGSDDDDDDDDAALDREMNNSMKWMTSPVGGMKNYKSAKQHVTDTYNSESDW